VTLVIADSKEFLTVAATEPQPVASSTPYLDRELPLPGANWGYRRIQTWQTVLIVGAFLFITPFEIYLLILGVTLIHELGHCFAGLIAGLEFDRIRVGPLKIDCYKRLQWEWNRGTIVGGEALLLPKGESALRTRLAVYIAGGPIANAATGFTLLHVMPTQNAHFIGLAQLFVAGSFIVGIGNLIPFRRHGFSSDGMKLVLLGLNKAQRWIFLLTRHAAIKRGELIPDQEVDPVFVGHSDGSSDYVGANWVAYTHADGKGSYDQAAEYLESCLAKCSTAAPSFREELILAAGRFQATRRRKNEIARQWLNAANKQTSTINYAYTEALILFSEGKIKQAQSKSDELSVLVSKLPAGQMKVLQETASQQLREIIGKNEVVCTNEKY
jgi:hypothetical protein